MILVIDAETTGLVDERMPPDHPSQPWLVSLSAELCDEDGSVLMAFSFIVKPGPGVSIPKAATDVHGITNEMAEALGLKPRTALAAFMAFSSRAELVVAHNIRFDMAVIEIARKREYGPSGYVELVLPLFCTMEAAAPIMNLTPTAAMKATASYNTKPKAPKLAEAYKFFTREELKDAHDSRADVAACRRVYFAIKELEKHNV